LPANSVETLRMTPGVSILARISELQPKEVEEYSRLAFEVLHNVQELVVDIELARELYFHLVQIAKGVLQTNERSHLQQRLSCIPTFKIGCWPGARGIEDACDKPFGPPKERSV